MAADAPAPCIARSSADMVLITMYDKQVLAFHEEGFQLSVLSEYQDIIENAYQFFMFPVAPFANMV